MRTLLLAAAASLALTGAASDDATETDTAVADAPAVAETLRVTGSSTVTPYALVAARGGDGDTLSVFVEATGTGAGLAALCGPEAAPLVGASRQVREDELALCGASGISTVVEIEIGLGAVAVLQSSGAEAMDLSLADLHRAVVARLPGPDCLLVPNRARLWSDVRPGLPERPIRIYGPPLTSGTRDILRTKAFAAGARTSPCLAALERDDPAAFDDALRLRRDGAWIDAGESDGAMVYALTRLPDAIGLTGRVHALAQEGLTVLPLEGIVPTPKTITDASYPLARPLYLYTTAGALTSDARVRPLVMTFTKPEATGPDGTLTGIGLVPNPAGSGARLISTEDGAATPLALGR